MNSLNSTQGTKPRSARSIQNSVQRGALTILLLAGTFAAWRLQSQPTHQRSSLPSSANSQQDPQIVPVSVLAVQPQTVPLLIQATGSIQPELEAPLSSRVMGRVQNVLGHEGDRVRKGQPLILLDASDLDASISQAGANLRAANIGYANARVVAHMESSLSAARIAEAQAKVAQSEASLQAASARLELIQAGPRRQEREQATLAVTQAKSAFSLAESNLKRMSSLYFEGAISAQQYDIYRSQYEVTKSQLETAEQGSSIANEGNRAEEIRVAEQAVRQAKASLQEANAGLKSAQASAIQVEVRKQEVQGAEARIGQSRAALQLASVTRSYTQIQAPFEGVIAKRMADPGSMAAPGLPLLIVQGGALRLEAIVPESTLATIHSSSHLGSKVSVTLDALKSGSLTGHIVEIAPQGDTNSHTFRVKIDLPSNSGAAPGMFGRARFVTGQEMHLMIPTGALIEREGLHYLYTVDEHQVAHLRMVTVGTPITTADGSHLPILSGLHSGERIVVKGAERLRDGSTTRIETGNSGSER